jgi:SAM-dependent methyltransferase
MAHPDSEAEMLDRPRELAQTFDLIAESYDARPGYPEWVFDLLAERCGLGQGTNVLEIGAGTGQATLPILDRGARITAVEPGAALARRLADRTRGRSIELIVSTFEDAEVPVAGFDMVTSATAFHWVDVTVGLAKCADALRDGGWLALWWNIWGDPERPDPFHHALEPILRATAPELLKKEAGYRAYARDLAARVARIEDLGVFGPVEHEILRWEGQHEPKALRRMLATFAGWIALPEPRRTELLDEAERIARDDFGGRVERPYQTLLYMAQRQAR